MSSLMERLVRYLVKTYLPDYHLKKKAVGYTRKRKNTSVHEEGLSI